MKPKTFGLAQKPYFWALCLFVLLLITFFSFFSIRHFEFLSWDDGEFIANNSNLKSISWSNFLSIYHTDKHISLALFSFSFDYQLFGMNSGAFHIMNLLIHLVNIILVYVLARKLKLEPLGALIVASLFALHPMRTETICWVMQRKDLLYTLLFLCGMLAYIRYVEKGSRNLPLLIIVFLAAFLSILCKLQAAAFPFVLILLDILLKRRFSFMNILEKFLLIWFVIAVPYSYLNWLFMLSIFFMIHTAEFNNFTRKFPFIVKKADLLPKKPSLKNFSIFDIFCLFYMWFIHFFIFKINKHSLSPEEMNTRLITVPLFLLIFIYKRLFYTYWILFYNRVKNIRNIRVIIAGMLVVIAVVVFTLVFPLFKGYWHFSPVHETTILQRLLLASYSLSYYIIKLFFPFNLNPVAIYPLSENGGLPIIYYLSGLLTVISAGIFIFLFWKKRLNNGFMIFCILFFLVNIFFVLHLLPIGGRVVVANRYTYISYLGIFLLAGSFIAKRFALKNMRLVLVLLLFFLLFCGTYNNSLSVNWKSSFTFWKDAVNKDDDNYYAWYGLGNSYILERNYKNALEAFDKSITIDSSFDLSFNNRGQLKELMGDLNGAIRDMTAAIELKTDDFKRNSKNYFLSDTTFYASMFVNRANDFLMHKQHESALHDYTTAISIYSKDPVYFANRSVVRTILNDTSGARQDINCALKLNDSNPMAIYNRGILSMKANNTASAKKDFGKATAIKPSIARFFKSVGLGAYVSDTTQSPVVLDNK